MKRPTSLCAVFLLLSPSFGLTPEPGYEAQIQEPLEAVHEYRAMDQPKKLPPLPYAYNALEPHISEQIMKLHHSGHHQTYVNNLNAALQSQKKAVQESDITTQVALQQAIKFNAGGHINHSLFWQNLTPASSADAKSSAAPKLMEQIKATWGDEEKFREAFKTSLLGIQGSGWGWLVKTESAKGPKLSIVTTKDQDPVVGKDEVPIFGVDMWEHAYYLQYQNGKAAYVQNIWNVINWKTAEKRFLGTRAETFAHL